MNRFRHNLRVHLNKLSTKIQETQKVAPILNRIHI